MNNELTIQELEAEGRELVNAHLEDWCLFAEDVLGVYLDDEQKDVLRAVQHYRRVSVKSGTSRGKDFVAAVAAMCFMYLTPTWKENGEMDENTKVFLIAPTERQVEDIMFPEISRLYNRAKIRGFNLPGRLVGLGIRTELKEWFMTGFKADDNNVVAWTGLHAANIFFIVTEAAGAKPLIFEGIEGNLHGNYRLLLVFNDNTGIGYAADTHKKSGWRKFRLDCLNAPNVAKINEIRAGTFKQIPGQVSWESINEKVKDWCQIIHPSDFKEEEGDFWWENENGRHCYRPNDLFRVKVRGMGPKVSSGVLVPPEWIELANKRWLKLQAEGYKPIKPLRLGVDVAGMGNDSSSFVPRYGDYVSKIEMIQSGGVANHMEIAGKTKNILDTNPHAQGFIDTIGEGAGVYSRCVEQNMKNVFSAKGSEAAEWNDEPLKDYTGCYEFVNMRAYLYWAIRDWLNPLNNSQAALPPDVELLQELTSTQWKFRSDGKIQIEPKEEIKKRIKRSPDKGDGLAMTFYPVPDINPNYKKKDIGGFFR